MFNTNTFVIYFTMGVPFGMLSIYLTSNKLTIVRAALFTAHTALWPAFAVNALAKSILVQSKPKSPNRLLFQNDLKSRFESIIPDAIGVGKRRALVFELQRFMAVSEAVTDAIENAAPSATTIHTIVEHPFSRVAAKCRRRKLISQLARHQTNAFMSIYHLANEQGINIPDPISSELNTLNQNQSADILLADNAYDRMAA